MWSREYDSTKKGLIMSDIIEKYVMIADKIIKRADAIDNTIKNQWHANVMKVYTAEELLKAINNKQKYYYAILFAAGFSGLTFEWLQDKYKNTMTKCALIVEDKKQSSIESVGSIVIAPINISADDTLLIANLCGIMGSWPIKIPHISNTKDLNTSLKYQIRSIDKREGRLEYGIKEISTILSKLVPEISNYELFQIGQGHSGANVFGVSFNDPNNSGKHLHRVLKLTSSDPREKWKCLHEVEQYTNIEKEIGDCGDTDIRIIPRIIGIRYGNSSKLMPVVQANWLGILYSFIWSNLYHVVDFEKAYLDPNECWQHIQKTKSFGCKNSDELAINFIEKFFKLFQIAQIKLNQIKKIALWSFEEASDTKPIIFPPYRFRFWEKSKILGSTNTLAYYGESLLKSKWNEISEKVLSCIHENSSYQTSYDNLFNKNPVLLTPVHGDLNAKNLLLSLEHGVPFLIDLACYQSKGHYVQDYARLEVAIKFELMGREIDNKLEGKDINSNSFYDWCKAEDWLCKWYNSRKKIPEISCNLETTSRAFSNCYLLRKIAKDNHDKIISSSTLKSNFWHSYFAALLYHTIRAIRYDSLPHLKRIFAIYSAAKIVDSISNI